MPSDPYVADERFVPAAHRGSIPEPEHFARYGWAQRLTGGAAVLDVGCGTGHGTAMLGRSAELAIGIDLSAPAVAAATRDHGAHAAFRQADARKLPFGDGEFDVVTCFETIAEVAETSQVLDELRRVLRPRGVLLLSWPNLDVYPAGNPLHASEQGTAELQADLATRFAHVTVHRQQTYHATLLGSNATLAHDDPGVRVGADVTKTVGGQPGSELYAVAAATDGQLPPEPAVVVLGRRFDEDEQRRLTEMWQERCIQAEAEALALRNELHLERERPLDSAREGDPSRSPGE